MKRKLCVQKVISYKEQKLSQYTGKQYYVIKNEEDSDYYFLSNRKMIEVVFYSRVSLLAFYFRESFKYTNSSLTEEKAKASSAEVINLGIISILKQHRDTFQFGRRLFVYLETERFLPINGDKSRNSDWN